MSADTTAASGVDSAQTSGERVNVGNFSFTIESGDLEKIKEKIGNVLQAQIILRGDNNLGYGDLELRSSDASAPEGALTGTLKLGKSRSSKKTRGTGTRARGAKRAGGRGRRSADDPASGEELTNEENGTSGVKAVTEGVEKLTTGEAGATDGDKSTKAGGRTRARGGAKGAAKVPRPKKERGEPSKTLVFIRNLPFSLTEEGLGDLFKSNSLSYVSLSMPTWRFGPRKGKGRGYAFATVSNEEDQTKAIETLNGTEIGTGENVKASPPTPAADGTTPAATEDAGPAVERKLKLVARQGYENEEKNAEQEHQDEEGGASTTANTTVASAVGTNGTGPNDSGTAEQITA